MLTKKELKELRDELLSSKKPLIYFDDDTDGLCSFLLYYRFLKDYVDEVKGVILKISSELDVEIFIMKAEEYAPDKLFVLDKAVISQDFLDAVHCKVVWLDHHPLLERKRVTYYNPLKHKSKKFPQDTRPTSYWAYQTTKKDRPNDLWLATVGTVSDWHIPEFLKEFAEKYPDILSPEEKIKSPGQILFDTRLGKLCRIIYFNLRFSTKDAMTSVKIMTRINDPYEILEQKTPAGKFLYKQYEKLNEVYERIRADVKIGDEKLVLFQYDDKYSITPELSNELTYRHPDRLIVVARDKDDSMKCSFRSGSLNVRAILEKSLIGIDGHGGGHEKACGGAIVKQDLPQFLDNLRRELKDTKYHIK